MNCHQGDEEEMEEEEWVQSERSRCEATGVVIVRTDKSTEGENYLEVTLQELRAVWGVEDGVPRHAFL